MEFSFTPEQQAIRNSAQRLVAREIEPVLAVHDPDAPLPKPAFLGILSAIAGLGLTAARLPPSLGGPGISMLEYGIAFEPLPASVAVSLAAHEATISRLGTECNEKQRGRLLPDLIAGRKICCTGSTEPDTGSDPRGVRARLTGTADGLVLNGRKMWITNVSVCDVALVTCIDARRGQSGHRVVKVIVERERSPFEARETDTIGLRQGYLGECAFADCPIPAENVIESERGGTEALKASWAVNRPLFGLVAVNLAERAYLAALDYAKARRQFGKPIAAHQLIQKNLSDIATAITASRLLCYSALATADAGLPAAGVAAMAKRFAQTHCQDAVFQAMNVLGAMGLSKEAGLERFYRDIRMIPVPDGTNEILALIHGRELTGMEAFRGAPVPA